MRPVMNNTRPCYIPGNFVPVDHKNVPGKAIKIGKAPENAVRIGKAPKNAVPVKHQDGGVEKQKLTREEFEKLQAKINRQSQSPTPAFGADEFSASRPSGNSKLTLGAQRR